MKKIRRLVLILGLVMVLVLGLSGCAKDESPLDPDHPTTVRLWHYYNGATKERFDALVNTFNETVGMEKGIVVDAMTQGDVQQLADAVFAAANETIGSQPLPDIFAAYPDNAFRVNQIKPLVDMASYFTEEEIAGFRDEFVSEGAFGEDGKFLIIPVAKSSENLYLNKTSWDVFASETGATLDQLATWEGVLEVSKLYYEWSGGKAFISIDSAPNFFLITAMQLGQEVYTYGEDGTATLNYDEVLAKKHWETFYEPYLMGYYKKLGRFSSDDAKVGNVIAYTGSTAGATYFPTQVTLENGEVIDVESAALPYPYFADGSKIAVQQGAGMCILKSDEAHEYAAAAFLKWFTKPEQNLQFAVATGYFPVMDEALTSDGILEALNKVNTEGVSPTVIASVKTTTQMFEDYKLYGNKPFKGSYEMRLLFEKSMFEFAQDKLQRVQAGDDVNDYLSDETFSEWYNDFIKATELILTP